MKEKEERGKEEKVVEEKKGKEENKKKMIEIINPKDEKIDFENLILKLQQENKMLREELIKYKKQQKMEAIRPSKFNLLNSKTPQIKLDTNAKSTSVPKHLPSRDLSVGK